MSEFLNYKVDLTLHDGSKSSGIITNVDNQQIVLSNAYQTLNPGNQLPNLKINSSQIADLKVIQLPPEMLKHGKNKRTTKTNGYQGESSTNSEALLDDAIVFAKSSSPASRDFNHNKERNPHGTPGPSLGTSRSNTPRTKVLKINQSVSSAGSVDPDWGHEREIQEIKGSNDFDFAANLAMFDKKSVFADFHKNDSINPGDRLVGHNKLENAPKPKNKKEKYDNDEMILDVNKSDNWDYIGNESNFNTLNASDNNKGVPLTRNVTNENLTISYMNKNFKLVNSQNLGVVPLCSPVQMLEIERLSSETYGITPTIMVELCASNLSQLISANILGGSTRLNKKNHNLPPLVLLLIGSGRCGSRAFATGRHLSNHGVRVLAFVLSNDDTDKELANQWSLFTKCGGKVITPSFSVLFNVLNNDLDTPVELIIDALQGYDDHLEDIFYQEDEQKELTKLMNWCNQPQQKNKIMALDIPSGIDGGSGTVLDPSLKLNCKWCVSMGLPITGLIHAYKNGHLFHGEDEDIIHYLVDVGIPNKVYSSKGNLRKFDKFWYSADYSIRLNVSTD